MRMRLGMLAGAMLAGCAALPPESLPERPQRASIQRFEFDGRIAVRSAQAAMSASISWLHDAGGDDISVRSPLGAMLAHLVGDASGARLETAQRESFAAADIGELGRQVFGLDLPLARMPDWVIGRSGGTHTAVEFDARGRIARLTEQGWSIEYPEYESDAQQALPRRVFLRRGEIDVRLAVERWEAAP